MIGFDKYGKKTELEIKSEIKSLDDKRLINIDPSSKGFFDTVLDFNTDNKEIRNFKKAVEDVKKAELTPFWRPVMDPAKERFDVVYKEGNDPATGYSFNQWRQIASEMPAVEGKTWKVGTVYQYNAFLVWLINQLVESYGWSSKKAIEAVVLDSKELGHYYNSKNAMHDFEATGIRECCGVYDLANTIKIIASNTEADAFWFAGGCYDEFSYKSPLNFRVHRYIVSFKSDASVGWLVLS